MLASAGARAYMGWIGALGAGSGPNDKTKLMVRGSPPPPEAEKTYVYFIGFNAFLQCS